MMAFRDDPENPARIIVAVRPAATRSAPPSASSPPCSATSPRCCSRRAVSPRSGSRCRRSTTICATCSTSAQLFSDRLAKLARSARAALRAQADARARARHRVLPVDAVLRPRAGAAARPPAGRARAAGRGGARDARPRRPTRRSAGSARSSAASMVDADPDQLFRVLLNLARNARAGAGEPRRPRSRPRPDPHHRPARGRGGGDRGVRHRPRLLRKARAHLFEAFQGSTRTGGTGLGLAIAAELVRAHGGDIRLVEGTIGATFRLTIPDRAVELQRAPRRAGAGLITGRGFSFYPQRKSISVILRWPRSLQDGRALEGRRPGCSQQRGRASWSRRSLRPRLSMRRGEDRSLADFSQPQDDGSRAERAENRPVSASLAIAERRL